MSVQVTSLHAHHQLVRSGQFTARQSAVYQVIREHPSGITIRQIAQILGVLPSDCTGALAYLRGQPDRGIPRRIAERHHGHSPITGKTSIFWGVAGPIHERQAELSFA